MIKAVIFDFYLTLIHLPSKFEDEKNEVTYRILQQEKHVTISKDDFKERAEEIYCKWREMKYKKLIEVSQYTWISDLLHSLKIKFDHKLLERIVNARNNIILSNANVYSDVKETLQNLKDMGIKCVLLSNAEDSDLVFALLEKFGLKSFFDLIVTSEYINMRKPDPRVINYILDRMELSKKDILLVGDSLKDDILCGKKSRIRTVLIKRPVKEENPFLNAPIYEEFRKGSIKPDFEIENLKRLVELVNKINS